MTSRAAAARRHPSVRGVPEPIFLSPTTAAAAAAAAVRRGLADGAYADLISSSSSGLNEASNNVVDFSAGALLSETEQRAFADFLNRFATDDFLVDPSQSDAPVAPAAGLATNVTPPVAPPVDAAQTAQATVSRPPQQLDADPAVRPVGAHPSGVHGQLPAQDDVKFSEAITGAGANETANSAPESAAAPECGSDAPSVTKRKKSFSSSTPPFAKEAKPRGRRRKDMEEVAAAGGERTGDRPSSSAVAGGSSDSFGRKPGAGHGADGLRVVSKPKAATTGSGISLYSNSPILGGGPRGLKPIVVPGTRPGRRGAKGQDLLTESERKANHIASEQRRRQNIRIGFDTLCDLVPTLSQCHRSEALILQKSFEYIQSLLESKHQMKERITTLRELLGEEAEPGDDSGSEDGGPEVADHY